MHCGNSSDDWCMALFPHNSLSPGQWFYQRRSVYTSLQYMDYLLYDTRQLTIRHANFSTWTTDLNVNANVYVILLVAGILISALLIGIGIVKKKK